MRLNRIINLILSGLAAGLMAFALWLGLRQARADAAAMPAMTLNRPEDPVVVSGASLAAFDGQALDELKLYAYDGSIWSPIPFQLDERTNDITGTYVISEDGLLDANDELVFMAGDVGQMATTDEWPSDLEAQQNPRAALTVSDPLSPGDMGWVYLYRSTTLSTSVASYVAWSEALQTVTAVSYTASFTSGFVGLADLTINGNGVDVLDRQKTRVTAFILTLDEEDLAALVTPTVTIPVVGPVRGVANGGAFNVSIYGSRLESLIVFDTSDLPFSVDDLRTSLDLNNPTVTGITNYFNSNGAATTIDGVPDSVAASPAIDWYQSSGAAGGLFVSFPVLDTGGGTTTNYYKDDSTVDPNDTGDQRSYADSGLFIDNPGAVIQFGLVTYILPPGTTGNVGAGYYDRVTNPLMVAVATQMFGQVELFLPVLMKP